MNHLPTTLDELADFIEKAESQSLLPVIPYVDGHPINEVRWYEGGDAAILELREDKCTQFDAVSVGVQGKAGNESIIVTNPDGETAEVYFMPVSSPVELSKVLAAVAAS